MSAVNLLVDLHNDALLELEGWRTWAARRTCDCEALAQLNGPDLGEHERHRPECRFAIIAQEMQTC